jgi:hypothetical protein
MAAIVAVVETSDAPANSPLDAVAPPIVAMAANDGGRTWVLVAWPELLEAARSRLGSEAMCPFCLRRGRIVQVVALEQWRHRLRHGVG